MKNRIFFFFKILVFDIILIFEVVFIFEFILVFKIVFLFEVLFLFCCLNFWGNLHFEVVFINLSVKLKNRTDYISRPPEPLPEAQTQRNWHLGQVLTAIVLDNKY